MVESGVRIAHEALCRLLKPLVAKWAGIRETFAFSDPGDHDWAKGNARWFNGLSREIETLHLGAFTSADSLCDALAERARTRSWDPDYDEPSSAREDVLAAVEKVRVESGMRQGSPVTTPAPAPKPATCVVRAPLDLASQTDDELARRLGELSVMANGLAANDLPMPAEWALEAGAILDEQSRRARNRMPSSS